MLLPGESPGLRVMIRNETSPGFQVSTWKPQGDDAKPTSSGQPAAPDPVGAGSAKRKDPFYNGSFFYP